MVLNSSYDLKTGRFLQFLGHEKQNGHQINNRLDHLIHTCTIRDFFFSYKTVLASQPFKKPDQKYVQWLLSFKNLINVCLKSWMFGNRAYGFQMFTVVINYQALVIKRQPEEVSHLSPWQLPSIKWLQPIFQQQLLNY
jgi:hypothetical protein